MQESEPENIDELDAKVKRSMLILALIAIGSVIAIFVYLSFVS